jgi:diguanylate cyclase (GGDEF)-like protein/PAS domain S-box-containing protein
MISLRYRRVAWLIALLAVLSAGLIAHLSRQRFFAVAAEVTHTVAVREAIAATVTLLLDAETGQRGFLLTGDPAFLEPYERATANMAQNIAELQELTRDDLSQEASLHRLERLAREKLAVLHETIELRRNGQMERALAIVRGGHGKRVMDAIRAEADNMLGREESVLAERRRATAEAQGNTSLALLAGLALAIGLVVGGLAMVRRDTKEARLASLKLSESERAFRLLADNASDLIRILDEDGSHLYVSPSSKRLLGYTADELRAMAPEALLPEEDRLALGDGPAEQTSRGTRSIVHRMRTKSGELRWFETRLAPALYQPDGKPRLHLASRDITGRKQAEDELRRQEALLHSIVTNMGDGLVVLDAHRKYVVINPAMEAHVTHRTGDVSGAESWSHDDHAFLSDGKTPFPAKDGPLTRALRGESCDGMEIILRRSSDSERTFSVTARPIRDGDRITGAVGVFHDITAQRRAEHDLLESEQRWRVLSEASFEGMAVTRDGQILDTNATFARWLGRDPSEVVGMEGIAMFAPDDRERVRVSSSTGSAEAYEAHLLRRDGTTFPVEVRGRSVVFRGKAVQIAVIRDITERKAQEAELARRAEKLAELALRDELTRLYNRRGFLELARQHLLLATRSHRYMTVFYVDLNGMKIINDELGHEIGDRALVATAGILTNVFRASDVVARLGGDEFAVLAAECDPRGVEMASERVRNLIDEHNHTSGDPFQLSISMGAAVFDPSAPTDLDTLMQQADERMYEAKRARSDRTRERRAAIGALGKT